MRGECRYYFLAPTLVSLQHLGFGTAMKVVALFVVAVLCVADAKLQLKKEEIPQAAAALAEGGCPGQDRFDKIMCKSHMCTDCVLQWCTETCQHWQGKFPGCRYMRSCESSFWRVVGWVETVGWWPTRRTFSLLPPTPPCLSPLFFLSSLMRIISAFFCSPSYLHFSAPPFLLLISWVFFSQPFFSCYSLVLLSNPLVLFFIPLSSFLRLSVDHNDHKPRGTRRHLWST